MCLGKPQKVLKVDSGRVFVDFLGNKKTVKSAIELKPGDYVLCQSNFVVQKIPKNAADKMIKEWEEVNTFIEKQKKR